MTLMNATRASRLSWLILGLLITALSPVLFSQSISTFDFPNSSYTHPTAINMKGEITGYYFATAAYHGFIRRSNGSFASFDVPMQPGGFPPNAFPMDINNMGQITGFYALESQLHSFLRQADGTIVKFLPSSSTTQSQLRAYAQSDLYDKPMCGGEDRWLAFSINDVGQITGSGPLTTAVASGFLRAPDGSITSFDVAPPGLSQRTCPQAINVWGQIAGYDSSLTGFVRQRNGTVAQFSAPNASETIPTAINLFGAITGFYADSTGMHGFIRLASGVFNSFDPPGSLNTEPTAINALGEIAGFYSGTDGIAHSFVREPNGTVRAFNVPKSQGTFARSINLFGTITGDYFDGSSYHGFIRKK